MPRVTGSDATYSYNVPAIYESPRDPVADDDQTQGYRVGDEWLNTGTGIFFKCFQAAIAGQAVWLSGVPGPKGDQGEQGIQGPQGNQGPQGTIGPQGDPGATGDQGEQGIPGPTAVSADAGNLARLGTDGLTLVPNTSTLRGVTDASEAKPGEIGEYLVQSNTSGTPMVAETPTQISTISLSAGDWHVWGSVDYLPPSNVSPNRIVASISIHPNSLPDESDLMTGVGIINMLTTTALTSGQRQVLMTGQCRSNSSSPLTLYLVAEVAFQGAGQVQGKGYICARRTR